MLARLQLASARRLNARLADRTAELWELDDAVRAWERLLAKQPEDWWTIMGLAEALLRRGNRSASAADLRRGAALFAQARRQEDRTLARVGEAMCTCALGWIERDAAILRAGVAQCAALRREPGTPFPAYAQMLVAQWQTAARLAHLTGDPRDARAADELARMAEGLLGDKVAGLRDDPRFLHA